MINLFAINNPVIAKVLAEAISCTFGEMAIYFAIRINAWEIAIHFEVPNQHWEIASSGKNPHRND